jgi:hypothetical protein
MKKNRDRHSHTSTRSLDCRNPDASPGVLLESLENSPGPFIIGMGKKEIFFKTQFGYNRNNIGKDMNDRLTRRRL